MKKFAFLLSLTTMFLFGALDMTRGVAAPLMQQSWHLNYLQLGNLFAANSLGYLIGSLFSGFVLDKRGLKFVMFLGAVGTSLGVLAILTFQPYLFVFASFLLLGFGTGWLEIGVNGVVPAIAATAKEQSQHFNVLHGFYGIGACCFPVIAGLLNQLTHGWRFTYILIGMLLIGLTVTIAYLKLNRTALEQARASHEISAFETGGKPTERASAKLVLKSPMLYAILILIAVYVMAEGGVSTWLPSYLVNVRKLSITASSWYLTGFYLTFTIGRLSARYWVHKLGDYRSIFLGTTIAVLLFAAGEFSQHLLFLFILAGFGFAAIFPTITSIASHTFGKNVGMVLGLLFTSAGIGSMIINWLIGFLASIYGLQLGYCLVPVLLFVVFFGAVITQMISRAYARGDFSLSASSAK